MPDATESNLMPLGYPCDYGDDVAATTRQAKCHGAVA